MSVVTKTTGTIKQSRNTNIDANFDELRSYMESSGDGFIIEGTVSTIFKHNIKDGAGYHRFMSFLVNVTEIVRRVFKDGIEVEPKSKKAKRVGKHYLNVAKAEKAERETIDANELFQDLSRHFDSNNVAFPMGWNTEAESSIHPNTENSFEFWGDVDKFKDLEIEEGHEVRLKTKGNSICND